MKVVSPDAAIDFGYGNNLCTDSAHSCVHVSCYKPTAVRRYCAAVIFAIAALTDSLDGYAARMRKEVTRFGQLIDPLADKLLVTAALFTLVEMGRVSSWIAIIIVGREFAVSGLRIVAAVEGVVIPASTLGKVKTALQMVAIVALLLQWPVGPFLMILATVFTVLSG